MKTNLYFKQGKNNISWVGSNFQEWFGETSFIPTKKAILKHHVLTRKMIDQEILSELKPEEVTLAHVVYAIEHSKKMLKNGYANIFYIKDQNGLLRTVDVRWRDDGWDVYADVVSYPGAWRDGDRVFSRNFGTLDLNPSEPQSLSPSDTLTLESAIERVKAEGYVIYKSI